MKTVFTLIFLALCAGVQAQETSTDSIKRLNEVTIKGYYNKQTLLRSVSAVALIDRTVMQNQQNSSMVSTFNTVSGLRMEERSPGSYRLSLRGSLLRSPFGIRNIKIYVNDFPLTDASGNTYLNALDPSVLTSVEVYKGPEASIYGANTGGTVLLNTEEPTGNETAVSLTGGSFGLFHQTAKLQRQFKNYSFSVSQGFQRSDGYRENSSMQRKFIQTFHKWNYNRSGELNLYAFYSDLDYQTPGGLTQQQYDENPKWARPSTATIPGAVAQQAAIYNKTFFAGLSNSYQISPKLKHVVALFTTYTDFKNPFITNYENRYESSLGLRTFLEFSTRSNAIAYDVQAGFEGGSTRTQVKNYGNNFGTMGSMQADDNLKAFQNLAFVRVNIDVMEKLLLEMGSSVNFFNYNYQRFFPVINAQQNRRFDAQFMPKIATSYLFTKELAIRASVSKGYSPPTIAEVRSSDQVINNNLQAEYGWNYEFGLRFNSANNRFYANLNAFDYRLKDAIVRRLNDGGAEYFLNAGGTKQKGLELETAIWIIRQKNQFLHGLRLRSSYSYSNFKFDNFTSANLSYNGNKLTGVPKYVAVSSLEFIFPEEIYFFAQHNFTSSIPLNDAGTVLAKRYHLIELKAGVRTLALGKTKVDIFAGINNLLDTKYSLGNDLNAVGGRYFNASAGINFYSGLAVQF